MTTHAANDAIQKLLKEPCRCVSCPMCRGTWHVIIRSFGYPEEDMESCEDCVGGVIETCDRCQAIRDIEYDSEC